MPVYRGYYGGGYRPYGYRYGYGYHPHYYYRPAVVGSYAWYHPYYTPVVFGGYVPMYGVYGVSFILLILFIVLIFACFSCCEPEPVVHNPNVAQVVGCPSPYSPYSPYQSPYYQYPYNYSYSAGYAQPVQNPPPPVQAPAHSSESVPSVTTSRQESNG